MTPQTFSRWFTDWPSTHVNAGRTVEVMPVSEHEAVVATLENRVAQQLGAALVAALNPEEVPDGSA